ncbi:unnamed protein product [Danaus chrysippus]|uniref:(African queen) hypothetical protein n=1 Tax=Danaus chrysippus TaxID=151541 RepID=A0A8J2W7P5_9NEOP|nr:unnamed protein product [Danaus chrysippus]
MANKCYQCGKFLSPTDGVKCCKCSSVFHRACTNISPNSRISAKWSCRSCTEKGNTVNRNTDSSKTKPTTSTESPLSLNVNPAEKYVDADMGETSANITLVQEIRLLRLEMATSRQEMAKLNSTMSEFNNRINKVEERMTALEQQVSNHNFEHDSSQLLQTQIQQLKADLSRREQESMLNDIQISGLPEQQGENLMHLCQVITNKIGTEIDALDVVSAERVGPRRSVALNGEQARPRPVVVRLARRTLRNDIIQAARVRRVIDTSGIMEGAPKRIYINERLTATNRQLFHRAKEEGKKCGWRYIWSRDGKIYVRREPGSSTHRIWSDNDINKIFGASQVGTNII